jgi:FkbM family methyltransferase
MSIFTKDSTLTSIVKSFFSRTIRLTLFVFLKRGATRFVLLTPSCLKNQVIFDRKTKRIIKVEIRDHIDFCTVGQIYMSDDYGIEKLKRANEIRDIYKKIVKDKKSPLIIDCGGNIGLAAKYFSQNYPEATILCIEPDAENMRQAEANNSSSKVKFFKSAIGSEEGTGEIIDPGLGNNAYRIESKDTGNTKIISINQLLKEYEQHQYVPFIVKIDIEGFEFDLFSKNTEWVDKFPLLIVELHDWMLPKTANSKNFIRTIAPLERDFVYHGENIFSISNRIG